MNRKNRNKGFSLIEIIIVIALMAIVTGASMSIYSWIRTQRIEKLTENISDCINEIRTHGMSKDGVYRLEIKKTGENYIAKLYASGGSGGVAGGTPYEEINLGKYGTIKVTDPSGSECKVSSTRILGIQFNKSSGELSSMTLTNPLVDIDSVITIEYANQTRKIVISELTGKHYIEK